MFVKCFNVVAVCGFLVSKIFAKEFTSYWNIPTFACGQRFNLPVLNVTERYGIIQNAEDNFRGDQVTILYNPGLFPAIVENGSTDGIINGGVPQEGNLKIHLHMFAKNVDEFIPDKENSGLAIIDFESWRPVYRQNFGKLQPYKELSIKLVKDANPLWSENEVENEAKRLFSEYAKSFIIETIVLAKHLRPKSKWGYYGLPFCFNGRGNVIEDCEKHIQHENDGTQWLYDVADVIFPSVYMTEKLSPNNRTNMVRGRVKESIRLSRNVKQNEKPLVIVYHRYKFTDSLNYLSETDNVGAIEAMKTAGADGMIVWGAWKDVNTKEKCIEFYEYLENILGPIIQSSLASFTPSETPINTTTATPINKTSATPINEASATLTNQTTDANLATPTPTFTTIPTTTDTTTPSDTTTPTPTTTSTPTTSPTPTPTPAPTFTPTLTPTITPTPTYKTIPIPKDTTNTTTASSTYQTTDTTSGSAATTRSSKFFFTVSMAILIISYLFVL